MPSSMLFIWVGALLIVGGLVYTARQAIQRGRLSEARPAAPGSRTDTLEPRVRNTTGFGLKANWPGLALIAAGALLLLVGAAQ